MKKVLPSKKRVFTINVPIFTAGIKVFVCTVDEFRKYRPDVEDNCQGCFLPSHNWMWFNSEVEISPGLIAHECIHAVNCIYEHKGIQITMDNDEVLAYSVEWMVDKIFKKIYIK